MKYILNNHLASLAGLIILVILLSSCSENKDKLSELYNVLKNKVDNDIEIQYPFNGSTFPEEIGPPTIIWNDKSNNTRWALFYKDQNSLIGLCNEIIEPRYKISTIDWGKLKKALSGKSVKLIVTSLDKQKNIASASAVEIKISKDRVEAPVFYRAVTLPFKYAVNNLETISWRIGGIVEGDTSSIVLDNLPLCGNCHSFTPDGKTLAMDFDYANDKGSYFISEIKNKMELANDNIITWSDYKRKDGEQTFGLLSQVSPDGRYVVSTVKDRSIFVPVDNLEYSQLFFPIKGILAVYDRETKKFFALNGANDPAYVQSNPVWSPNGKKILFARTDYYKCPEAEKSKKAILPREVADDFIDGRQEFKYDIYSIDFNEGRGGDIKPLPGASNNGKSNFFPKYSPDGKWIVFCKADNFMLLQKDSKMFIMPAEGGEPREMNCNLSNMNSWHSWSPNGKWLVFASKYFGPYTQLFITHIDENGIDSPPVWLENLKVPERAANIPEFLNAKHDFTFKIREKVLENENYSLLNAMEKIKTGDFKGAIYDFNQAAIEAPDNYMIYSNRGMSKYKLKDYQGAIDDCNKALELNSKDFATYNCLGFIKVDTKDYQGALKDLTKALEINPKLESAYYERGMAFYYLKDYQNAIRDFNVLINANNQNVLALYHRGLCYIETGENNKACEDMQKASDLGMKEAAQILIEYCR